MKYVICSLAMIMIVLMTFGCHKADNEENGDWVFLHSGHFDVNHLFENADYEIYYDKKNVTQPSKDRIRVWFKKVARSDIARKARIKEREKTSKSTKGYENYKETLFFTEVNCTERGIRFLRFIDRDASGRIIGISIAGNDEWQYYGPDELPAKWIEEFCPAKKSWLRFFK